MVGEMTVITHRRSVLLPTLVTYRLLLHLMPLRRVAVTERDHLERQHGRNTLATHIETVKDGCAE
jgi:hypothetical protein